MNLPKTVTSTAKIRFQDCDPFNHLNNGKYIDYFMNHREDELINNYDIDIYKMAKQLGKSWLVKSNQIAYLKPAFLMEAIIIESELFHYDHSNLKVEMRMYNADKSHLKAIIWCSFAHFNLITQKREKHAEDLMDLFKNILNPKYIKTFEERLTELKTQQ